MPNRLAEETSPYLLQHRNNPVDWHPWGAEALERARVEDRPLLVSIGYSACHWCHVMEHESFENPDTAAYMNEHFVCIKVDREERPDLDAIYMQAVQSMTGHGGWPLTAFCDPDGVPFYGGTYFPPEPRGGMPGFLQVMEAVVQSFQTQREQLRAASARIREQLGALGRLRGAPEPPGPEALDEAVAGLRSQADLRHGGFGGAPKFPPASALEFLMARGETASVEATLDAMAAGGIRDQLGGGFARYSVDAIWLVPHFEKMLYDNALLARAYLHGWQLLGHERWRTVCVEALEWVLREMRGPEGGFFAALDADSEGEEGRYYVWSVDEMRAVLDGAGLDSAEADSVLSHYGVSDGGNFEGRNILHLPNGPGAETPPRLEEARAALLEARSQRVRPGLDDKRICSWNALMLGALAEAGAVLGREDFVAAARDCAEFVWTRMRDQQGHLLRTYKDGEARLNAYLEDHAFLIEALLSLYEATFEPRWFEAARETAEAMIERFADPDGEGFFTTSHDHEELIARRKDTDDHPIPSGNSSAALGLLRLAALTGEHRYEEHAVRVLRLLGPLAARHPQALAHLLQALHFHHAAVKEVALLAPAKDGGEPDGTAAIQALADLLAAFRSAHRPATVLAGGLEGATQPELLRDRGAVDGRPAAYVCERFACKAPVTEPAELVGLLE